MAICGILVWQILQAAYLDRDSFSAEGPPQGSSPAAPLPEMLALMLGGGARIAGGALPPMPNLAFLQLSRCTTTLDPTP